MTFTYPTCSPIAFWHRRTAPNDQMANNSLIQSANPAHSHDHEYLSGRPSDEDLEIEINAFRRNTIDFLASYLATREAIAHNHAPGGHMNGSNGSTDISTRHRVPSPIQRAKLTDPSNSHSQSTTHPKQVHHPHRHPRPTPNAARPPAQHPPPNPPQSLDPTPTIKLLLSFQVFTPSFLLSPPASLLIPNPTTSKTANPLTQPPPQTHHPPPHN